MLRLRLTLRFIFRLSLRIRLKLCVCLNVASKHSYTWFIVIWLPFTGAWCHRDFLPHICIRTCAFFYYWRQSRKLSIYTSNIACIWNVSAFEILRFVVKETRHIKISVSNYDYSYSLLNVISKQKNIYLSAYLLLCIARNIRHTDLIIFFLSNKRWSIEILKWNLLSSYKKQTFWEKKNSQILIYRHLWETNVWQTTWNTKLVHFFTWVFLQNLFDRKSLKSDRKEVNSA